LQNEKVLIQIEKLISSFKEKHIASDLTPMSLEEFYSRNLQSEKEISDGKLISHEGVKRHF